MVIGASAGGLGALTKMERHFKKEIGNYELLCTTIFPNRHWRFCGTPAYSGYNYALQNAGRWGACKNRYK